MQIADASLQGGYQTGPSPADALVRRPDARSVEPILAPAADWTRDLRRDEKSFSMMAPLALRSESEWAEFGRALEQAKRAGAQSISTDVWWGMIETGDGQYDFSYYDRLADLITSHGLKWTPILSFHQCGGNVGDDVNIPIPAYLRDKYAGLSDDGPAAAFCRSEQGNVSYESISPWASKAVLSEYREVMVAFQNHFSRRKDQIAEINVSLGPAGELRYPSYNSHDEGTDYPNRGALQAYSELAIASFREWAHKKYGSVEAVAQAWETTLGNEKEILPPSDPESFYGRGDDKHTQYGRDFFDWYNGSLVEHGRRILQTAIDVFGKEESPFTGIELGAKIPGIHWRTGGDRAAELNAGLIRTSDLMQTRTVRDPSYAYEPLAELFADLQDEPNAPPMVLHFTCLEMRDGPDDDPFGRRPRSLVEWVGRAARRHDVTLKGENALPVANEDGWRAIGTALEHDGYAGLTLLRLPTSAENLQGFKELAQRYGQPQHAGAAAALRAMEAQ
ncbi:MAG: family 14 glycosylhydrolase [Myxococcota bacterium]